MAAKTIEEASNILNQVLEIMKTLENNGYKLSNQDKLIYMYNSLPGEIKNICNPTIDENPSIFYDRLIKLTSFRILNENNNPLYKRTIK